MCISYFREVAWKAQNPMQVYLQPKYSSFGCNILTRIFFRLKEKKVWKKKSKIAKFVSPVKPWKDVLLKIEIFLLPNTLYDHFSLYVLLQLCFLTLSRPQQLISCLNSLSKLEKSNLCEWQVMRLNQHDLLLWNLQTKILYLELLPLMELCLETGH